MSDPDQLLWNHAVENEDWEEATRLQKVAEGLGHSSVDAAQNPPTPIDSTENNPAAS